MKKKYLILLFLIIVVLTAQGQIIINEVLVNEPGSLTSLEWIELFNNSNNSISLDSYTIDIGNTLSINLPDAVTLESNEYFIICRRLFEINGSSGFESYWGDSSGIWGDSEFESLIQQPFETSFVLTNNGGLIKLYENSIEVSSFTWENGGDDAVSWERKYPDSNYFYQSNANIGSSPGIINSVTPVPIDLSIDSVSVQMDNSVPAYRFYLTNLGLNNSTSGFLYLSEYDSISTILPFDSIEIHSLNSNETLEIDYTSYLGGYYHQLLAHLSQDDRSTNDSLIFTGIGNDYPPVIITELMANPQDSYTSEWIEIKNCSNIPINLYNWQIGDELTSHIIASEETIIEPGEYLIIAQLSVEFLASYFSVSSSILEPSSWSYFNNDGDIVRLIDNFGIESDRFEYSYAFDNNYSWSRDDNFEWGRSYEQFGSPGNSNRVLFESTGGELSMDIIPKYISPDNDGIDDFVDIIIHAPKADNFTVKIYDRYGRIVKTFYDQSSFVPESVSLLWDGNSDGNQRLPIGIYIIYVEAGDVGEIKGTVVIAR
jgi:gliding motility-associated-like protein